MSSNTLKLKTLLQIVALATAMGGPAGQVFSHEIYSVAVFDFESKEESVRDLGGKVSAIVATRVSAEPSLVAVERAELDKILSEQELGLSGTVAPATAAKIGHLTGAKILVTGRVFRLEKELTMVAKIIGAENGRMFGEMVRGDFSGATAKLAGELADKIVAAIDGKGKDLVVAAESREDCVSRIKKGLGAKTLPAVRVTVSERHFNGPTIDPAAETEIAFILQKCGFPLLQDKSVDEPEIVFKGEALSELGLRKGNLVSCKGRVELKAVEKATGRVLCVDRQTCVAVDTSEQIAAKNALQQAAQELASRMIPSLELK